MKTRGFLSVIRLAPLGERFCQERRLDSRRNGKRFDASRRGPLIRNFFVTEAYEITHGGHFIVLKPDLEIY